MLHASQAKATAHPNKRDPVRQDESCMLMSRSHRSVVVRFGQTVRPCKAHVTASTPIDQPLYLAQRLLTPPRKNTDAANTQGREGSCPFATAIPSRGRFT